MFVKSAWNNGRVSSPRLNESGGISSLRLNKVTESAAVTISCGVCSVNVEEVVKSE